MHDHGAVFQWLLFGHLTGLAVLAAGVGGYVTGLHRLGSAASIGQLRAAEPEVRWGERLTLTGFVLILATGIGLGVDTDAFDDAWLIASLALLVVIAAAGRVSGSRLNRLFAAIGDPAVAASDAEHEDLLRLAASRAIHFPADVTVLAIVEILYLMILQPGGWGIVVSLLVTVLAAGGAAWALGRAGTRSTAGVDRSGAQQA